MLDFALKEYLESFEVTETAYFPTDNFFVLKLATPLELVVSV